MGYKYVPEQFGTNIDFNNKTKRFWKKNKKLTDLKKREMTQLLKRAEEEKEGKPNERRYNQSKF